jgi:Calpain family cysteine protease
LHQSRFKQVQVTVDGNFPAGGSANPGTTQDVVGGKKEIWVQVLEKAYAKLHGGYSGIKDGGSPTDAMEALTGEKADEKSTGGLFGGISQKDLLAAFKAGKPIVMNTPDTKKQLPFNLVPNHAYMLEDIGVDANGKAQIKLRNPWGTTQLQPPLPIPFEKLHSGIDSLDIGGTLPKDKP